MKKLPEEEGDQPKFHQHTTQTYRLFQDLDSSILLPLRAHSQSTAIIEPKRETMKLSLAALPTIDAIYDRRVQYHT